MKKNRDDWKRACFCNGSPSLWLCGGSFHRLFSLVSLQAFSVSAGRVVSNDQRAGRAHNLLNYEAFGGVHSPSYYSSNYLLKESM